MRAEDMDGADRRILSRADPGRRQDDRERTTFMADQPSAGEGSRATPLSYLFLVLAIAVIGAVSVRSANMILAPMLYDPRWVTHTARDMHNGTGYATFDLNIETRTLRREHIRSLQAAPEVIVMGASHWQEAHAILMPEVDFYNAHVHRDYFEDIVAIVGWLHRYEKLPKRMLISIRDIQFMPPDQRTDYLWVPIVPDYRETAPLFGLEAHNVFANGLTPQLRQASSLPLLIENVERYLEAEELPHHSNLNQHPTLDMLLPDGSIFWSQKHRLEFTPQRARSEALALAEGKRDVPPPIDPAGVEALDVILTFLLDRGIEVHLAHPPYNPVAWDVLKDGPYREGLHRVEKTVADLAQRHGIRVVGSFNPHDVGCTEDMYIDGEHSSPVCLGKILYEAFAEDHAAIENKG